ncbi:MFS transporter [Streptomyces sp. NPDC004237]|uniref:MFS transporter n=1 Tax=Streptomyces sp. NPDC004237 TaxID=3154455 RepID=UPI0033A8DCF3
MSTAPSIPPTDRPADPLPAAGGPAKRFFGAAMDVRLMTVPDYRRLLAGRGLSYIGTAVTSVAVPLEVFALTHSSLYVGLTSLVGLVPLVVFGLYGGAVADRVDRRRLFLVAAATAWLVTLGLFAQALLEVRSVGLLMALVAVQSAAFAVSSAAQGAIIPRIVPDELIPAANTLSQAAGNLGQIAGPLLAGVLVVLPHGYAVAYGIDAVLFAALLHSAFRLPPIKVQGDLLESGGVRMVWEGLRFIASHPVLWMSFAVDIAAMVLAMPTALFPEAAATRFHGGVGLLYSATAIGALAAAAFSGWVGRVRRQGVALTSAVAVWSVAIALAGLTRTLWIAVALLICAGAADLISAVYRQTILQTYAPDAMRGRLQGVFTVVVVGGPRLGDLRAGATAAGAGMTFAWTGGALMCLGLVVAGAVAVRSFWNYSTRPAREHRRTAQIVAQ